MSNIKDKVLFFVKENKQNILPILTGTVAVITIIAATSNFFFKYFSLSKETLLGFNFGLHFLMTSYVVFKGYNYKLDINDLFSKDQDYHKRFFFVSNKDEFIQYGKRAKIQLNQLLKYWVIICGIWALFYLASGVFEIFDILEKEELLFRGIFNFFNSLETAFFISCYYILTVSSYENEKFKLPRSIILWWIALFTIYIFDLCFKISTHHKYLNDYSIALDIIGGILSCTFFSLFFARLDSKFLGFNVVPIAILFFYASLQAIFPILNVFKSLISESTGLKNSFIFKQQIITALEYFYIFGYYFALLSKAILYTFIYTENNKHKLWIYFMSVAIQSPKYKECHENFPNSYKNSN